MNPYDEVRKECCPKGWQPTDISWETLKRAMDDYMQGSTSLEITVFREYFGMNGTRRSAESIITHLRFPTMDQFIRRPRYELDVTSVETMIGVAVAFIRDRLATLLRAEHQERDTS